MKKYKEKRIRETSPPKKSPSKKSKRSVRLGKPTAFPGFLNTNIAAWFGPLKTDLLTFFTE